MQVAVECVTPRILRCSEERASNTTPGCAVDPGRLPHAGATGRHFSTFCMRFTEVEREQGGRDAGIEEDKKRPAE